MVEVVVGAACRGAEPGLVLAMVEPAPALQLLRRPQLRPAACLMVKGEEQRICSGALQGRLANPLRQSYIRGGPKALPRRSAFWTPWPVKVTGCDEVRSAQV